MKTLERLRQMKKKATDRMAQLNELARTETRELSAAEKLEYEANKATAEELAASITQLETEQQELAAPVAAPVVTPPPVAPPDTAALAQAATDAERLRISTIRENLSAARLPAETAAALEKELVDKGASVELASKRIFAAMAARDAAQPETRPGVGMQRGDALAQVETLSRDRAGRDGVSKERATVLVLNANPKLYDQYLAANPAQTGARQ